MSGEGVEVYLNDTEIGKQHMVLIREGDTLDHLKEKAHDVVLGSPVGVLAQDVELRADGDVLDDSTPLPGAAGVWQGCFIDVALSGARFVKVLQKHERLEPFNYKFDMTKIPGWARNLRDVALEMVRYPGGLKNLGESFRNDKGIVTAAVRMYGDALEDASEDLRDDEDVVLDAVLRSRYRSEGVLAYASDALLSDKPFVLTLVQRWGETLQHVNPELKADREVVMAAVQADHDARKYACESLRNDRQVSAAYNQMAEWMRLMRSRNSEVPVPAASLADSREAHLAAILSTGSLVPSPLRHSTEFQRAAVEWHGGVLQHADESLCSDKNRILAALETCPDPLKYAHPSEGDMGFLHLGPSFLSDRDFMLAVVSKWGGALRYASASLCRDKELQLAAVSQDGRAMQFADPSLRSDRPAVLQAARAHGEALQFVDPVFCDDEEVVLAAVKSSGHALPLAPSTLRSNREVVLAAVRQCGRALHYASPELCSDNEVVLAAVRQDGYALHCASPELCSDKEVVLAAVRQEGCALHYATPKLCSDKEVVLAAVRQDGYALHYASPKLCSDKEVVLAAVQQEGCALQYASTALCCDKEVVLAAVRANPDAFPHASAPLRRNSDVLAAAFPELSQNKRRRCL